jgi:hypothetical protein
LVVVSYAKRAGGLVTAVSANVSPAGSKTVGIVGTIVNLTNVNLMGSPVILAATGEYATIIDRNGSNYVLDKPLSAGGDAYVITEAGGRSPALTTLVVNTNLDP